jgi:hypothetical protein
VGFKNGKKCLALLKPASLARFSPLSNEPCFVLNLSKLLLNYTSENVLNPLSVEVTAAA